MIAIIINIIELLILRTDCLDHCSTHTCTCTLYMGKELQVHGHVLLYDISMYMYFVYNNNA